MRLAAKVLTMAALLAATALTSSVALADITTTDTTSATTTTTTAVDAAIDTTPPTVTTVTDQSKIVGTSGNYAVIMTSLKADGKPNYMLSVGNGTDSPKMIPWSFGQASEIAAANNLDMTQLTSLAIQAERNDAAAIASLKAASGTTPGTGSLGTLLGSEVKSYMTANGMDTTAPASATTNNAIVRSLYQTELGRTGEEAGITYWADQLNSGAKTVDQVRDYMKSCAAAKGAGKC